MQRTHKKIFGVLFFSLFATVTGVGIVVPLLPVYAHQVGAQGFLIGLIFGAFSLSRSFFLPYFGRRSDQLGRKPFIVTGLLAYAVISIAFWSTDSIAVLIGIRFLQGIASAMIMPVVQAYVGDITPPGKEGTLMGLFNLSHFWGLSLGPLMGGFINDRFSLDTAFLCMGALAFVGFALSQVMLPPRQEEQTARHRQPPPAWRRLTTDRDIIGLLIFRFAYTACIGVFWGFFPVFADTEFALSSATIGFVVSLTVFIGGLLHTPMGVLADRIDRRAMVTLGGLIVSGAIFMFRLADGYQDLLIAGVLFGIGGGIAMPALNALAVLKGSATCAMGSVMGLLTMAHSVGMLAGALLAGLMMDLYQLRTAFLFGALLMLGGVGLFLKCTGARGKLRIMN